LKSNTLLLIPSGGGDAKELMRRSDPQVPVVYAWSPDSKSIFARVVSGGDKAQLWRVTLDGNPPVKLEGTVESKIGVARLHPDGGQIAFQVNDPPKPSEVWVTENFLPKAASRR
jgi:dipeptidyl aminopeptidase/acylaminoacyl peptidase